MGVITYIVIVLLVIIVGLFLHFKYWKYSLTKKLFSNSQLIKLSCGEVEYAIHGEKGPVLLISHGGAMGYDNIDNYDYLLKAGFRLLCPSKPGYLRTKVEVGDTFEKQADMFAELLDKLEIKEKVGVIALSMGGPAALQFALRHPDKLKCLIMQDAVSKTYHPSGKAESSLLGKIFLSPIGQDIGSYMMDVCTQLWPKSMFGAYLKVETIYDKQHIHHKVMEVMLKRAPEKVGLKKVSESHRRLIKIHHKMIKDTKNIEKIKLFSRQISPMSLRSKGTFLELDLAKMLPRYPVEKIHEPTLVTHSKIDRDVSLDHGEFVAQSIQGAELYTFDGCGHMFWFGEEGDKIEKKLISFLGTVYEHNQ